MLIAISGSQGSGKSTIINRLKSQHQGQYEFVERKTSRSILEEWNVSLQEVNNNLELTVKFQKEILRRKQADDMYYLTQPWRNFVIFTERTFADLFTYALVALGKDNEYNDFINQYYKECLLSQKIYDIVFYLKGGLFQIEHDGVRGTNHHYGRMIDATMFDITKQITRTDKFEVIDVLDLDTRHAIITEKVSALQRELNK